MIVRNQCGEMRRLFTRIFIGFQSSQTKKKLHEGHKLLSAITGNFDLSKSVFLYARRRRDVLCYHPGRAGGVPHSLSGAYLQDYASYGYETSWVDRSHQGGVQCVGTITLACLIFELLSFVYFHT